ncbi:MAG TPA: hypothetical protein VFV95_15630 [Vicinamibacterales bacterium]|nr:hypothetical protein [Vicinamibacterales bacterium]
MLGRLGKNLDDIYAAHGNVTVNTKPILDTVRAAKGQPILDASGNPIAVAGAARAHLDAIEQTLQSLGPSASLSVLRQLKQLWDPIAFQRGLVAADDLTKQAQFRVGADAIRRAMADAVPELQPVNTAFGNWKNISDATRATIERRAAQHGGIIPSLKGTATGWLASMLGLSNPSAGAIGLAQAARTTTPGRLTEATLANLTRQGLEAIAPALGPVSRTAASPELVNELMWRMLAENPDALAEARR